MKKILVTGSSGFIGGYVCAALRERGLEPVLFDVTDGHDVRDLGHVVAAMRGVDHVVHLAALVSVPLSIKQPQATFQHNVLGMQNILDAARLLKFGGRVIHASSAAVYGTVDKPRVSEPDADGVQLLAPYGASKRMNEEQAAVYRQCYDLQIVGLRFFNAYGAGQSSSNPYAGVLSHLSDALLGGRSFTLHGDGLQTRDFIAVQDIAAAVVGLLRLPPQVEVPSVMNVGTGMAVTLREVIGTLEKLLNKKLVIESQPTREGDIRNSCADVTVLRAVLPEWRPVSLEDGLRSWLLGNADILTQAA